MSWDAWASEPKTEENPTWGDYGKAVTAGVTDVARGAAADLRYYFEQGNNTNAAALFEAVQGMAGKASDDLTDSMTPEGRDRLTSSITSEKFWEHPASSLTLKATRQLPMMVATALPGLMITKASRALAATAAAGGALSAGDVIDQIYSEIDKTPDDKLKEASELYAALRTEFDEKESRRQYTETLMGMKPAVAFALGVGAGAVGPAANIVRGVKGAARHGVARSALEGASTEALEEGVGAYNVQDALIEGGIKKDFDERGLVDAVLEGGVMGGLFGGATGIGGGKGKAKAQEIKAKREALADEPIVTPEVRAEDVNQQVKGTGTGNQIPPVETAPTGDKQNQPTRSETVYPKAKGRGRKNQNEGVVAEVVDPGAPTVVEAAAVADLQQKAQPEPEIPNVPEAPPVAPPAAPQEVAAPVAAPVPDQAIAPSVPETGAPAAPVPVTEATPNLAPVAPDAPLAPAEPVAPPEIRPQPEITPAEIRPQPGPRVLQNVSPEAKALEKAGNEQLKKNLKAAAKAPKEASGERNRGAAEKAILAEREKHAKEIFEKHAPAERGADVPTKREERTAMAAQLAAILKEAGERGLVAREDLPPELRAKVFPPKKKNGEAVTHTKPTPEEYRQGQMSIPQKVAGARGHVMYLREAMAIRKLLEKASPLTKSDRDRIQKFMVEERAFREGDDQLMAARRKEDGERENRQDQGDVENAPAGKVAKAMEDLGNSDHVSPEEKMIQAEESELPDGVEIEQGPSVKHIEVKPVERIKLNAAEKRAAAKAARAAVAAKAKPKAIPAPVAEKKPVISATSDAAVTRAGKKTNTEPTDKQKEAGNYAKGTVEWNGLHVALETPKGTIRKGMAKIGGVMREWSVQMQDHYGYVKRTEGADGDQVDVFMGPNPKSDQVWVIDQQDFNGKFDEHKAMLGYDSQQEAMFAYDRAYSDGRGFERIKDIQSMTADEFKAWVKSDKPKKAKKEIAPDTTDEVYALNPHDGLRLALEATGARDEIHSTTAYDALKSLDLSYMTGVSSKIAPFVQRRLMELVGDTPFHTVSERDMAGLFGRNFEAGEKGPQGSYIPRTELQPAYILKRADAANDPLSNAHVTLHEVTHAATQRALESDPKAKAAVRSMMNEAAEALADNVDGFKAIKYALTNEHEFIAEAFSNPQVQDLLARIDASKELAAKVGLAGQKKFSLWDTFIAAVRKAIGLDAFPGTYSMLEVVLKQGADLMKSERNQRVKSGYDSKIVAPRDFAVENTHQLMEAVKSKIATLGRDPEIQRAESAPWLALRTIDQISQVAGAYFRGNNPVRRIADLLEMRRVKAMALLRKSEPLLDELATLQKKYTKDGDKTWEKFTSLVHDETTANVFADRDLASQTHLGKDVLGTWWSKAQHAGLAARYAELPQDLRDARVKAMKYFADQQNAMSLGIIKNILKVNGISDDALARRIHTGTTLDTDADLLRGDLTLDQIKAAKELAKIEGPYFPLMRRGDFVVQGTYDIATPANATKIEDNVFEFTDRKAVVAYEQQLARDGFKPSIQSRWVDKNTGDTKFPDGTRVTKNDTDAEQRFRVTVQNRHVEFFDSKAEAEKAIADLEKEGVKVKGLEAKRWEPGDRRSDLLSSHMRQLAASLQKRQELNGLDPKQKNEVVQALNEASLRFLGSTRIQARRLPRRYVLGASNDLTRNTLEYAQSTSGYLAKLEHQPELEVAMKAMRDAVDDDSHKTAQFARSKIANEMEARVASNDVFEESNTWSPITKRIMTLSFLDKLFSPAFNIINSLQPAMVTMPTLAARYGVGKSFDALSRAYSDVSGMTLVKAGFKDSARKVRDARAETTDLFATIKSGLNAKERAMIDYLAERGSIDPEAGMEIASLIKARSGLGGKVDVGLGYLEGIARQMPQAIEMVNRSVTALATYRLEMGRGATHEQAMVKAQEAVNNTQGLYSTTNAAPIFNHPVAKLALQFKKYGQMMYHLLGSNIGKALRNASPEERAEALKTLAGIAATHVAMAGALGLPTEPFKYLLMGAQAAGLTTTGWNDVENKVREKAANWFGKTGGEIITKGLPRAAGIDLSSRVGLDSLISFGEPKSNKDTDVKSWLFDTVAGAPAALVSDWVKGANALTSGEFTKAAELLVPMKFAADSIKAYRLMTEGKKGSTGKETMKPYSAREAITRAIGFTPAREAEEGAKRSAFYSAQKRDSTERNALMSAWVSAKPQDKFSAWKKIQSFNKGRPSDQQITMSELTRAADKRRKEGDAIRTTKRDREYLRRAEATYNP